MMQQAAMVRGRRMKLLPENVVRTRLDDEAFKVRLSRKLWNWSLKARKKFLGMINIAQNHLLNSLPYTLRSLLHGKQLIARLALIP